MKARVSCKERNGSLFWCNPKLEEEKSMADKVIKQGNKMLVRGICSRAYPNDAKKAYSERYLARLLGITKERRTLSP